MVDEQDHYMGAPLDSRSICCRIGLLRQEYQLWYRLLSDQRVWILPGSDLHCTHILSRPIPPLSL